MRIVLKRDNKSIKSRRWVEKSNSWSRWRPSRMVRNKRRKENKFRRKGRIKRNKLFVKKNS